MKPKKNPKRDLNRNSGLYFAIGLMLVLCLTFVAFEWKTYDTTDYYYTSMNSPDDDIPEELPPMIVFRTPPPPVIITPSILEIISDEEDKPETDFDVIEPDQETEVLEISDIPDIEEPIDTVVPFSVIEDVPVFPGCENEKDKRACFQEMMNKHIIKNFRYPEIEQELGIQGRVNIMFEIQEDGSIGNVRMRGPNKNLEKEAARIINKLPKMSPGKQRGNAVRVPYSIPINFKLQ